jgi:hypothetical protein
MDWAERAAERVNELYWSSANGENRIREIAAITREEWEKAVGAKWPEVVEGYKFSRTAFLAAGNNRIRELEADNETHREAHLHWKAEAHKAQAERDAWREECLTNWHEYGSNENDGKLAAAKHVAARLQQKENTDV